MRARRLEICFISSKIVKFIMNKTHDIRVVFQLSYFHSFIFCIIIILSFTMTVGILMLHCGLGIRNTNTFYTFRCPQSLEMIRLYLCKKCKLERDMTLCGDKWLYEEASLKKSRSSLLNSVRKQ